jgi:hypothetical protein
MSDNPAPLTNEAATEQLERYAALAGKVAAIGGRRNVLIARANAAADKMAAPIVAEMAEILATIETWWSAGGKDLLPAKRKSIELGGCMIGSKVGATSLININAGGFDKQAELMRKLAWAEPFVRVTVSIDKGAVSKAMAGPLAPKLKGRGFRLEDGTDEFFLKAVAQSGAVTTSA